MNLLANLRTLWAANATLVALVPLSRIWTGRAPDGTNPTVPYVVFRESFQTQALRTRHSYYFDQQFTIHIWANTYNAGRTIRDALTPYLLGRTIVLDSGRVIDLSLDNHNVLEETEDPTQVVWQFISTFTAHLTTTRSSSGS